MTITIAFDADIRAPVAEVWKALVDFDHWSDWHPHRQVVGKAELKARVIHVLPRAHPLRRKTPARIDVLDDGRCLSFRFGRWPTGYSFEQFRLAPIPKGTRLEQVAIVPAYAAALNGGRERYEASVREAYRRVADALSRRLGSSSPARLRSSGHRGRL